MLSCLVILYFGGVGLCKLFPRNDGDFDDLDYGGMFCAVDILHRVDDDVWELYEVKDSPEVKPQFIKDAAYQAWVLDKCGVQLDGVFVV